MLTEKELDLVTIELETVNLDLDVYRQETKWGVKIVYYMLDLMLIERGIIEPLHFYEDDFDSYFGKRNKEELFDRMLDNTVNIFQIRGMPFVEYLKIMEREPINADRRMVIRALIDKMESLDKEHQPLCITGTRGIRAAVGAFSTKVLEQTCRKFGMDRLIIGICNNDFAPAFQDLPENLTTLKRLMKPYEKFLTGLKAIRQKAILKYDVCKGTLDSLEENA